MPLTLQEAFDNGGDLLKALGKAVSESSDGGKTITMSEIIKIFSTVGIKLINDIND